MKKLLLFFMTFLTLTGYAQFPEGFEGTTFPPSGWAVFDNLNGNQLWIRNTTILPIHSGIACARINAQNVSTGIAQDWLVTPLTLVPTDGQLRFYCKDTGASNQGSSYSIRVSTTSQTNPASFTTIKTWTETDFDWQNWQQKFVALDALPNNFVGQNVYIAFVMENDNGDRWLVDDVKLDSRCKAPTGLTAVPQANTATVSWNSPNNPTGPWEIEYGLTGFVQGTAAGTIISVPSPTSSWIIPGLTSLTGYTFYVRSLCDTDNPSPWSISGNFTTTPLPPECNGNYLDTGLNTANYGNNQNEVVTITPPAGQYVRVTFSAFNVEANNDGLYVFDGSTTAAPQITSGNPAGGVPGGLAGAYWGNTIPGPFEATNSNGTLTFQFRSNGTTTQAGWISSIECLPFPSCPKPSFITSTPITATTTTVNWINNAVSATQWHVIALPTGSPAPTAGQTGWQVSTNPASHIYTGLTSNTTYDFYVRAVCASGTDIGPWSTAFSTSTTHPDYCGGDLFYDTGGPNGDYSNNETRTWTICPDTPGDVVTVFFNSFNINDDTLKIYDGNSTAAPLVGTFTGYIIIPTVGASNTNTSGCLTFVFTSNATSVAEGWEASVVCGDACPTVTAILDQTLSTPLVNGKFHACKDENITFSGTATAIDNGVDIGVVGATYQWQFDDGVTLNGQTASRSFTNSGVYQVNLLVTLPSGCRSINKINQIINVSTDPIFTHVITDDDICAFQSSTLTVNHTMVTASQECVPSVSGLTAFLPDKVSGQDAVASLSTVIVDDCFGGATITSGSQIENVCLNIEHSFSTDITIELIAPNGVSVFLHSGNGSTANLGIPWAVGPTTVDAQSANTTPGVGFNYCFNSLATTVFATAGVPGVTFPSGNGPGTYIDASIPAGTYAPAGNFNNFIGSPIAGTWTLKIIDDVPSDNGYLFGWNLEFGGTLVPVNNTFTPTFVSGSWTPNPDIVSPLDNPQITVTPTTPGTHCYTYNLTNNFGCVYSHDVCITVSEGVELDLVTAVPPTVFAGENGAFNLTGGTPLAVVFYNINGGTTQQITLDAAGEATVNVTNLQVDTTLTTISVAEALIPTTGNVIATAGGTDPNNSIGSILPIGTIATNLNSTRLTAATTTATLTLAHELPAGTTVTVSLCRDNDLGSVTISDNVNTITFNNTLFPGALDVLQHIPFTLGANTDQIKITRVLGNAWIDGITYNFLMPGCDAPLDLSDTIEVTPPVAPFITSITNPSHICSGTDAVFTIVGSASTTVTYTINGGTSQTIVLDASGNRVITVTNPTTDVTLTISELQLGLLNLVLNPVLTKTIVVNPLGQINTIADEVICKGGNTTTITFATTNTAGTTTYTWTNDNTDIGLAASSSGNATGIASFVAQNTTSAPITGTITVIPTYTNGGVSCIGTAEIFTITVNPLGQINTITDEVICRDGNTTAITFATANTIGTTTYTWTNDNPAIGLAASSGGDATGIASFVAQNTTSAPITGTITVTPTFTNDGVSCIGATEIFTITVNPLAQINTIADEVICKEGNTTAITFATTNTIGITTYTWTNDNPAIGLAASSGGDATGIESFVAQNTTSAPITGTITVTPTFTNDGVSCIGATEIFTITVNPLGQIETIADEIICQDGNTTAITFATANIIGTTTYTWTNDNPAIGLAASSGGDATGITSFEAQNTTSAPITGTITVTPTFTNDGVSCIGTAEIFTITVNPTPQITDKTDEICSGETFLVTPEDGILTDIVPLNTLYSWTVTTNPNITGASDQNNQATISQQLENSSGVVQTITYTITPISANGCVGNPFDLVVTVNPEPVVANQAVATCSAIALDFDLDALVTGTGDTYTYTVASIDQANVPAGPSRTVASDVNITDTYTNTTNAVVTITYTITPIGANGCVGNPFNLVVTVNPEPAVSNQAVSTCSDSALDFNLDNLVTGTGDTYTYTVASSNQANVPAGPSRTVASAANITDTYTNTTNAAATITYTITPIGANGCVGNPFDLVVKVEPNATVSATPASQVICTGSSTSINLSSVTVGTSPITYQWTASILTAPNGGTITGFSNNSTGNLNVISQILQNTGTSVGIVRYSITPFNGLCAGSPINVDVSVNPQGNISAINNQTVCNGNQSTSIVFATANTTGTTTYTWTNDNPNIGLAASSNGNATGIVNFPAQNTTNAPITGTISVTPTFTNGGISCVGAPITFTITVNPSPTLTLTSAASTTDQTICVNTPITPIQYTFGSGATGVTAMGLPAGLVVDTTGNLVTISGTPTTTVPGVFNYTITATGNACGAPALSGTITLTDGIQPFFNQVAAVCEGVTPNLPTSSNNLIPITGYWTQTGTTASSITYEFTPDENQCALPDTEMTIQVNPRPAVIVADLPLTNTISICSGESINLLLSSLVPNAKFYWNTFNANGVTGHGPSTPGTPLTFINQTLTLNPGVTSSRQVIYYIYAEANGCLGPDKEVKIIVNPVPNVVVKGNNPSTICSGETTNISFEGSVSGTIFNWVVQSSTGVSGAFDGQGSVLAQQLSTTGLSQGQVVYKVTPRFNGCTGASVSVTVFVNPIPQFFGDNSNHPQLCSGVDLTSIAFSSPNPNTIYSYTVTQVGVTGATNGTFTGQDLLIAQLLTTTTTIQGYVDYEITATLNGCSATSVVVRVYVNPLPRPVLQNGTICVDSDNITFQTYLLNTGLAESLYDFVWFIDGVEQLNANTSTFVANVVGTYSVIATNTLTGCKSQPVSAIVSAIIPATTFTVDVTNAFSDNAMLTVTVADGTGDLLYQLDDGPFQESNIFTNVSSGEHIITVIDTKGCTYLTQEKTVIGYPKYFTPNGDGYHDTWKITGLNQPDAKLFIFDRYGKLIKQIGATDNSEGWDGTFNGQLLPSTDYWFSINYKENGVEKQFKAHFSMKR